MGASLGMVAQLVVATGLSRVTGEAQMDEHRTLRVRDEVTGI